MSGKGSYIPLPTQNYNNLNNVNNNSNNVFNQTQTRQPHAFSARAADGSQSAVGGSATGAKGVNNGPDVIEDPVNKPLPGPRNVHVSIARAVIAGLRIVLAIVGFILYSRRPHDCTDVFWIKPAVGDTVGQIDKPAISHKIGSICPLLELSVTMAIVGMYIFVIQWWPAMHDSFVLQMRQYAAFMYYFQLWMEWSLQIVVILPLAGANDIYEIAFALVVVAVETMFFVISDINNSYYWVGNDGKELYGKTHPHLVPEFIPNNWTLPYVCAACAHLSLWAIILVHLFLSITASTYATRTSVDIALFLVFAIQLFFFLAKGLQLARAWHFKSYRLCIISGDCTNFLSTTILIVVFMVGAAPPHPVEA